MGFFMLVRWHLYIESGPRYLRYHCRNHSGHGLSQREIMLKCDVISHWLSSHTEWSLHFFRWWLGKAQSHYRVNADLLSTRPPRTNFSEISNKQKKIFKKIWKLCLQKGSHFVHCSLCSKYHIQHRKKDPRFLPTHKRHPMTCPRGMGCVLLQVFCRKSTMLVQCHTVLLTHLPLVLHICIRELGQHWFR